MTTRAEEYVNELLTIAGLVLVAILGWVGTMVTKKLREPTRIETLWARLDTQDKKIESLDGRVDVAERKSGAASRIVRDLARQWPHEHVPRLNPSDLDELDEDTIPAHWKAKPL